MATDFDTDLRVDETSMGTTTWRAAVPAELFERIRAKGLKFGSENGTRPVASAPAPATAASPVEAAAAALPVSYRAPYMPQPVAREEPVVETMTWNAFEFDEDLPPREPSTACLPTAFLGFDKDWQSAANRVLVSVRPVLDVALADEVARRLDLAPGMSAVRSLGAAGDIAAFEADYNGPIPGWEAVSQALRGLGASLVSSGDREFYLAIQGRAVS